MSTASKRLPRVCPWTTEEEFGQVHRWLYAPSTDPTSQELGVKRVKAWSSRGRVPHAAEHTASFIEVGLRDRYGALTQHELRLMYCMCFIRCINDLVDQEQKSTHALSVQGLADRLGLPSWFAELRHAGTHDALPSLPVLRTAISQALSWLEDNYWNVQQNLTSECVEDLRPLLLQYKECQKKSIRSEGDGDEDGKEEVLDQLASLMIGASPYREAFANLLVEPGYLVPMGKRKRATIDEMELPRELERLWDPLLAHLGQGTWPTVWDDLSLTIVDRLEWSEDGVTGARSGRQHMERTQSVKLTLYEDILEACLRLPSPFTRSVLRRMCQGEDEGSSLVEEVKPVLEYMDRMFTGPSSSHQKREVDEDEMKREVDGMEGFLVKQASHAQGTRKRMREEVGVVSTEEGSNLWRKYGEDDNKEGKRAWKACPLGCLPNGQIPDLSLPLEMDYPPSG
ncbi:Las1-like-domain-containing protein [Piptocephalis cylindrospora]|uniref:Las1-like-domain-containing protein n=1 Tax=Piptocephalis cylindrospora TaxID=1907219 RepID=A0A4P9Y8L2_9FUNG|nr:Las1-like-domain-containing protein [Piptocephalis cylindrospora]|eukprot:RKP15365.1 Las1-like-domain-containing protein [Piptocephalis cylindrospora]